MQKDKVNAKCPHCGAEIYLSYDQGSGLCPTCRKEFDNKKAVMLYKTLHEIKPKEEQKTAKFGEEYLEVERILKRIQFYIDRKEFRKAREEAEKGLEISNTDYRLYFEIVRAETKNFTDYKNQSHKPFLDKAVEVASAEEKKIIMRLYKNYYQLSHLTDEELLQYKAEENVAVKKKLEERFKAIIPMYMKKERGVKIKLIIGAVMTALAIALPFISEFLLTLSAVLIFGCYFIFKSAISIKKSSSLFNALLDVYDALDSFDLSVNCLSETLSLMKALRKDFERVGNLYEQEDSIAKFCKFLLTNATENSRKFVLSHPVLKKYALVLEATEENN